MIAYSLTRRNHCGYVWDGCGRLLKNGMNGGGEADEMIWQHLPLVRTGSGSGVQEGLTAILLLWSSLGFLVMQQVNCHNVSCVACAEFNKELYSDF